MQKHLAIEYGILAGMSEANTVWVLHLLLNWKIVIFIISFVLESFCTEPFFLCPSLDGT